MRTRTFKGARLAAPAAGARDGCSGGRICGTRRARAMARPAGCSGRRCRGVCRGQRRARGTCRTARRRGAAASRSGSSSSLRRSAPELPPAAASHRSPRGHFSSRCWPTGFRSSPGCSSRSACREGPAPPRVASVPLRSTSFCLAPPEGWRRPRAGRRRGVVPTPSVLGGTRGSGGRRRRRLPARSAPSRGRTPPRAAGAARRGSRPAGLRRARWFRPPP